MRFAPFVAVCLMFHPPLPLARTDAQKDVSVGRVKMIEINGKEHPELIPEYVAWQATLNEISHRRDQAAYLRGAFGHMPPAELAAILNFADEMRKHDEDCTAHFQATAKRMQAAGSTNKEILDHNAPLKLTCRQELLDAVDHFLPTLGDSQHVLADYAQETKTKIDVLLKKEDWDFYRLPR